MKRKQHIALLMAGTLLLSAVLPYTQASQTEAAAKPKLSVKKLSLNLGKSKKVQVKNVKKKQLKKITWKAKNKKIVTVKKSGKLAASIKGKKTGTTKVTAKIYLKTKKKPVSSVVTVTVKKDKKPVTTPKPTIAATSLPPAGTPAVSQPPAGSSKPWQEPSNILEAYDGIFDHMGVCANYYGYDEKKDQLRTRSNLDFIKENFNSITLENEMKPDSTLSTWGIGIQQITLSQAKEMGYYIPENYPESKVPLINYDTIDSTLETLKKEGLQMRGHTFVWHQQTPAEFFVKNYSGNTKVTPEIMDARLEFFVRNMMRRVMDKEKELTGSAGTLVYAWDVVNEYIHRTHDATRISWHDVYGDMGLEPSYVKKAFEIAYEELENYGVQDKVVLYINDYNTYECADDIISVVNFINSDATDKTGKPVNICSGIGMQSHLCVDYPTVESYGDTLEKFLNTGLEVSITELDASINYGKTGDKDAQGWDKWAYTDLGQTDEDQADYIKSLMETIVSKQKNLDRTKNQKGIASVTVWGLYDKCSWKADTRPLLFGNSITDPKESYYSFMNAAAIWYS
ncbi:MAG: endo-1,4-beta-xylanase [Eubacterium sp.]|nr:endo-1,4-beta-xylanase [Eubacterium sp.]